MLSAGKYVTYAKRGKICNRCQVPDNARVSRAKIGFSLSLSCLSSVSKHFPSVFNLFLYSSKLISKGVMFFSRVAVDIIALPFLLAESLVCILPPYRQNPLTVIAGSIFLSKLLTRFVAKMNPVH